MLILARVLACERHGLVFGLKIEVIEATFAIFMLTSVFIELGCGSLASHIGGSLARETRAMEAVFTCNGQLHVKSLQSTSASTLGRDYAHIITPKRMSDILVDSIAAQ